MQRQLDDGLQFCIECKEFGFDRFCGRCGRRYLGGDLVWRECPRCEAKVSTDFCGLCGCCVCDEFLRKWEDGDVDLDAESDIADGLLKRLPPPGEEMPEMPMAAVTARSPLAAAVLSVLGGRA